MSVNDLKPSALPHVAVRVPADEWDNIVRTWGIGYCCEWFGHSFDGEFALETLRILQERYNQSQDQQP